MEKVEALGKNGPVIVLCDLASQDLATFALKSERLSAAKISESARLCFAENNVAAGWLERMTDARQAHIIFRDVISSVPSSATIELIRMTILITGCL
jgi:hypothetical protein